MKATINSGGQNPVVRAEARPETSPESNSWASASPKKAEWIAIVLLVSAFLVFNILTYNQYPQVWCDEVWFSEPAVNLVKEGVFHTRGFMFQPTHTFPIINCPLYLMVQVPWVAAAGTSVQAIRSLNYSLMAVAAALVWIVSWRFHLVRTAGARILLIVLLHFGYGMSYAYRSSRPDILAMNCLLLLLLSFTIQRRLPREICIFTFSAITCWIGFQVALFALFAAGAAVAVLRVVRWRDLFIIATGLAAGAASLAAFLWWKNSLANFLLQVFGIMGRRYAHGPLPFATRMWHLSSAVLVGFIEEYSTTILVLGLAVILWRGWRLLSPRVRAFNVYCLILTFALPLFFDFVGHWAFYYSYMRFIPVSLALFATVGELTENTRVAGRWNSWRAIGLVTVAGAIGVGLPTRLTLVFFECQLPRRAEILEIIRSNIHEGDVVLSDHAVFFEVKQVATEVYDRNYSCTVGHMWTAGGHDFSEPEKQAMLVLVIRPEEANLFTNFFGGIWLPVGPPFGDRQDYGNLTRLPLLGGQFARYSTQPQNERYQVQIFRREKAVVRN